MVGASWLASKEEEVTNWVVTVGVSGSRGCYLRNINLLNVTLTTDI